MTDAVYGTDPKGTIVVISSDHEERRVLAMAATQRLAAHWTEFWHEMADFWAHRRWLDLGYGTFKTWAKNELPLSWSQAMDLVTAAETVRDLRSALLPLPKGLVYSGHQKTGAEQRAAREKRTALAVKIDSLTIDQATLLHKLTHAQAANLVEHSPSPRITTKEISDVLRQSGLTTKPGGEKRADLWDGFQSYTIRRQGPLYQVDLAWKHDGKTRESSASYPSYALAARAVKSWLTSEGTL